MTTRRTVLRSALVGLPALLASAFPAAFPAAAHAEADRVQPVQPLGPDGFSTRDREFLVTIRNANLWEIPVGRQAAERSDSAKVRDVGKVLVTDHTKLDVVVKKLAEQFDVDLPDRPTSKQQQWLDEISAASGEEYNRVFATRVRAAHATVFGLVAEVRGGTRNRTIRDFAQTANTIVLKHITLLEGTGYVTVGDGMFAEASARTLDNPENKLDGGELALGAVAGAVAAGATIGVVRTLSTSSGVD